MNIEAREHGRQRRRIGCRPHNTCREAWQQPHRQEMPQQMKRSTTEQVDELLAETDMEHTHTHYPSGAGASDERGSVLHDEEGQQGPTPATRTTTTSTGEHPQEGAGPPVAEQYDKGVQEKKKCAANDNRHNGNNRRRSS